MRVLLKQSLVNPAGKDLYVSLYASWCHSPMAIISLCFLAQVRIYNSLVFIATTITMFFFSPTRWGWLGFDISLNLKFLLQMCMK